MQRAFALLFLLFASPACTGNVSGPQAKGEPAADGDTHAGDTGSDAAPGDAAAGDTLAGDVGGDAAPGDAGGDDDF